jgi:hypothetical protein
MTSYYKGASRLEQNYTISGNKSLPLHVIFHSAHPNGTLRSRPRSILLVRSWGAVPDPLFPGIDQMLLAS